MRREGAATSSCLGGRGPSGEVRTSGAPRPQRRGNGGYRPRASALAHDLSRRHRWKRVTLRRILPENETAPWNGHNEDRAEGAVEPFQAAHQETPDAVALKFDSHRLGGVQVRSPRTSQAPQPAPE